MTPIFWINLDSRSDRRRFMEQQLTALGLEATRIAAVSPATIDAADPIAARAQTLAVTEACVTASHRAAWRAILQHRFDYALILEDDVLLSRALPAFLAEARAALEGLDVVRIETGKRRVRVGPRMRSIGGVALRQTYSAQWGTAGYMITAACAQLLSDDAALFSAPLDRFLFDPTQPGCEDLVWRQCAPGLCMQGDQRQPTTALWTSDVTSDRRRTRAERAVRRTMPQKLAREVDRVREQMLALTNEALARARGIGWMTIELAD